MTFRRAVLCVVAAAFVGLLALVWTVPGYLTSRGFPLDDAWIYAVYGRSLAQEGMLAYNPGIPATGATSPLWPVLLAILHLVWPQPNEMVMAVKLVGIGLHVVTAVLLLAAFRGAGRMECSVLAGAMLVALHPDLIGGSASGMELPLATAVAAALLAAGQWSRFLPYLGVSFVAPLARPELGLLALFIPVALHARLRPRVACMLGGGAILGTSMSFGVVALRNIAVSGRPLVATFYAKAGFGDLSVPEAEFVGFSYVLGAFPVVDSSVLVSIALVVAIAVLAGTAGAHHERLAGAAFLGALLFSAASFALVRPIDPGALYHQRYILPVLPLFVMAMPVLLDAVLMRMFGPGAPRVWGLAAVLSLFVVSIAIDAPARYRHLENDARNIDDIQVALGKSLAAADSKDTVWAVDAGAVRYFGSAFVVDMIGLNTDAILQSDAQQFLDRHPPTFLELVPGWSMVDEASARRLGGAVYKPSTPYTVSGFPSVPMQRHFLARCDDAGLKGRILVRQREFGFRCASRGADTDVRLSADRTR